MHGGGGRSPAGHSSPAYLEGAVGAGLRMLWRGVRGGGGFSPDSKTIWMKPGSPRLLAAVGRREVAGVGTDQPGGTPLPGAPCLLKLWDLESGCLESTPDSRQVLPPLLTSTSLSVNRYDHPSASGSCSQPGARLQGCPQFALPGGTFRCRSGQGGATGI